MKTSHQKAIKMAAIAGLVATVGASASAQTLDHYYYGAGGASITSDQVGTAHGTLYGAATLSGGTSGYLLTDGGDGGLSGGVPTEGMLLNSSAVSGITGSFSISTWIQAAGNAYQSHLFDFSDGTGQNMIAALAVDNWWPNYPPHAYASHGDWTYTDVWADTYDNGNGGAWLDDLDLHNLTLTYDGSYLSLYVDGGVYDSQALSGFNLSALTTVGVAGGSPWAVADRSFNGTTYSFGIFDGALSQSQMTSVYGLGKDATAADISAALVPEPSTLALSGIGGLALLMLRRRSKS